MQCAFHSFRFLILLLPVILPFAATAQSLTILGIDRSAYPIVRARFFAFDTDMKVLSIASPTEIAVLENGVPCTVLGVECPVREVPKPISAVLTMDMSGSMGGGGLDLAKAAAHAWIDAFPVATSQCAITSFNHANALVQDFTNDRQLLRKGVDALRAGGGTSFDAAFTSPFAGAIPVVARGAYRRIIVLLTDGQARGNETEIIAAARQAAVTVFCITLDNEMPDVLKQVAEQTGGQWYENVTRPEDIVLLYRSILEMAQLSEPCTVTWESAGCAYERDVIISLPMNGTSARAHYAVPEWELTFLEIMPSRVIAFGAVPPGSSATKAVTITARNKPVDVRGITVAAPEFSIIDYGGTVPPFMLMPGQSRTLTLRFAPSDSSYAACFVDVESNSCESGFWLTGGSPGKGIDRRVIRLLHPNGGEVFVAGSDTVVTWKGVAPTDPVKLELSTDAGMSWQVIAENVQGLSYRWRVPRTPSDYCLVRVTTEAHGPVPEGMVLIPDGSFIMGDNTGSGSGDERPAHRVTLTAPFYLSQTEVTQRDWMALMGSNPSSHPGELFPVDRVTFREALEYCNRFSQQNGLMACYTIAGSTAVWNRNANGYRLPTEAEWEYACRAGNNEDFHNGLMSNPYCAPIDPKLEIVGWYCGNTRDPSVVGQKIPNAFEVFDMHGNVAEFCWSAGGAYVPITEIDPRGPDQIPLGMGFVIVRGGSFKSTATECRASYRPLQTTLSGVEGIGLRLVRNN